MKLSRLVFAAALATSLAPEAKAAFHLMQIEQVIGGVGGDATAQAITLRMRSAGQNVLASTRLIAWDRLGANPVVLFNFTGNFLGSANTGSLILLTSASFESKMLTASPSFDSEFTLTNTIPLSYLTNGGRITFSDDGGSTHYWSLAFGNYAGLNTGTFDNDSDGNFGAPFPTALPTIGREGIRFTGAATALSTTNLANYAATPDPATVRNNANQAFTVVPEPGSLALIAFGALALGGSVFSRRRNRSQR